MKDRRKAMTGGQKAKEGREDVRHFNGGEGWGGRVTGRLHFPSSGSTGEHKRGDQTTYQHAMTCVVWCADGGGGGDFGGGASGVGVGGGGSGGGGVRVRSQAGSAHQITCLVLFLLFLGGRRGGDAWVLLREKFVHPLCEAPCQH